MFRRLAGANCTPGKRMAARSIDGTEQPSKGIRTRREVRSSWLVLQQERIRRAGAEEEIGDAGIEADQHVACQTAWRSLPATFQDNIAYPLRKTFRTNDGRHSRIGGARVSL